MMTKLQLNKEINKEIQRDRSYFYQCSKIFKRVIWRGIGFILPPRCAITGDIVINDGEIQPKAWAELEFISDPQCRICGTPFDFKIDMDMECPSCLKNPPKYSKARAPLIYNDASRLIVLKFMQLHHSFMPWVMRAGHGLIKECDLVVPVPLHRFRLLKRRYNQAAIMARYISRKSGKPWFYNLLVRKVSTKTQGKMSFEERQKNVRDAFQVQQDGQKLIDGKTVLLVDDVMTTGATINECTKALLQAGAAKVYVLTIAKVVKR